MGEIIDPIADRVELASIGIAFAIVEAVPHLAIVVIIAMDAAVGIATAIRGHRGLEVSRIGKTRTALLMSGVCAAAFGLVPQFAFLAPIGAIAVLAGTVLHTAAAAGYLRQIARSRR